MKKILGIISALLVATVAMSQFQYWMFRDEFAAASRPKAGQPLWNPPDGLIIWWHCNNDWTDSKGTNVGVASGATFTNNTLFAGGASGNFDGNDVVDFGQQYTTTNAYSISMWVNASTNCDTLLHNFAISWGSLQECDVRLGGSWSFSGFKSYSMMHGGELIGGSYSRVASATSGSWSAANDAGKWVHVVVAFDNTNWPNYTAIYKDAVLQPMASQGVYTPAPSPMVWRLGARRYSTPYYYSGLIDEVSVYDRKLSATDVTNLFMMPTNYVVTF